MSLAHECRNPLLITIRLFPAILTRVLVFPISIRLPQTSVDIVETSLVQIGAQTHLRAPDRRNTPNQPQASLDLMGQR